MTFQPDTALAYARALARPRHVGTAEEPAIIAEIAERLEHFGYHVERQTFEFSTGAHVATTLTILGAQILILLTFWAWGFSAVAGIVPTVLLLALLAAAGRINRAVAAASVAPPPGVRSSGLARLCLRLGTRYRTANVVAHRPAGEGAPGGTDRPQVYLVAHWDSKSQFLPLAARMALIAAASGCAIVFALLSLLRPFATGLTSAAAVAGLLALVMGVPVLFLFLAGTGNASPGAIDNASGAGLVLHLAEVLGQARPAVPFTILITGAEELGVMGATAFVQRVRRDGRQPPAGAGVHVLNFDGIGTYGRLAVVGGGAGSVLARLVRECCVELHLPLGRLPLVGAQFDHIPFSEHGCDALSLVTLSRAASSVHTPGDDVDQLDVEGFRQAGEVALRVMRKLDTA